MTDRARTRELVATARALLREASATANGDLPTIKDNIGTAIVAATDVLDALNQAVEADIRADAILHNEYGKEAA